MAGNRCETVTGWAWVPGTCVVVYSDENGEANPIDFGQVLAGKFPTAATPSTFGYNPATHTVTHNGVPHLLNCGVFNFNPATCELSYTDEKGNAVSYFIPQDQFIYDATGCAVTIIPAKGGEPITFPVGVSSSEVGMELINGKVLEFTYKEKKCQITLPNSVVGCQYTRATNTLRMLFCDGSFDEKALAKASLDCVTLEDGTRIFNFQDGCGGSKLFNIAGTVVDMDEASLVGSVLTLTYGGDGNSQVLNVDICQIVGGNCNAHFTDINPDGSWSFIDNAGDTYTYPAPVNCCTYHGTSPTALNPAAPPGAPTGNYPNKKDGDTVIECHPNGTSYFTCINGNWSFDFLKLAAQEVHIGPTQPAKNGELKVWFDPITCVVKFCDNDGNWLQPTNLACQENEPPTEKGGHTLWYKPSNCCFSILCDGVWIGVNGMVMDALIQSLCIKIGDGPEVPITVRNGKAVIEIPNDVDNIYCIQVGDGELVFAEAVPQLDNKFVFKLPEFPEEPETCIRIGGTDAVPIVPHLEGAKKFLDLPAYPQIPELPKYCLRVGEGVDIDAESNGEGKLRFSLPAYPQVPDIVITDKAGNVIPAQLNEASGALVISLPPVLACQPNEPATNGSEGCLWHDGQCLHALCDSTWISSNLSVTQ